MRLIQGRSQHQLRISWKQSVPGEAGSPLYMCDRIEGHMGGPAHTGRVSTNQPWQNLSAAGRHFSDSPLVSSANCFCMYM